jgi:hypothetical protein
MITVARNIFAAAKAIQADIDQELGPPEEGLRAVTQQVLPHSVVRGTRGYIERVVNQANGAYENGWYDACAVMLRRLVETLIIEAFEHHKIAAKIKHPASGDFLYLGDLIEKCLKEPSWNLGRGCKRALPKLKELGDQSAHSRRHNAHRGDFIPLLPDVRVVIQELVYLAGLK